MPVGNKSEKRKRDNARRGRRPEPAADQLERLLRSPLLGGQVWRDPAKLLDAVRPVGTRADDVEAALTAAGFKKIEKREQDGEQRGDILERWAAFVFSR